MLIGAARSPSSYTARSTPRPCFLEHFWAASPKEEERFAVLTYADIEKSQSLFQKLDDFIPNFSHDALQGCWQRCFGRGLLWALFASTPFGSVLPLRGAWFASLPTVWRESMLECVLSNLLLRPALPALF